MTAAPVKALSETGSNSDLPLRDITTDDATRSAEALGDVQADRQLNSQVSHKRTNRLLPAITRRLLTTIC